MSTAITNSDQLARLSADSRSRVAALLEWRELIGTVGDLLIVPSLRAPRLAVPADSPAAAAAAITRHGSSHSMKDAIARRGLAVAVRSRLGRRLFARVATGGPGGIVGKLRCSLGGEVQVAMPLTASRANRKPVLHLIDPDGTSVGFAKLGVTELTTRLVRREARALDALGDHASLLRCTRTARVLVRGEWDDVDYVVFSPLPTWTGTTPTPDLLDRSMREIAELAIADTADRVYPDALVADLDELRGGLDGTDVVAAMRTRAALVRLGELRGSLIGRSNWHGDWTSWNCCEIDGRIAVWDWERFDHGVPAGFDALHYRLQQTISDPRRSLPEAARQCIDTAPAVLRGWYGDAAHTRTVAALYLAELSLRYLRDDQRRAGARGGDVSTWLTPALELFVADGRATGNP